MADPSSLWAQPDMLQTFSVTVMPSGHLASEDLQSFDYVLFTSEPAEESASDLTVFVTKRLDLQVQPLFYVSIAGKALGLMLDRIISRFLGRLLSSSNRPLTSQMPLLGSSPSSVTSQHPGQHRQLGQHQQLTNRGQRHLGSSKARAPMRFLRLPMKPCKSTGTGYRPTLKVRCTCLF